MERSALRRLGGSDLEITPLGLGTWAIGGRGPTAWGPQDDADSVAAIRRAVELGWNWIDTAPVYGLGHSERVVARALEGIPAADRPLVFTKVGLVWGWRKKVRHSLEPRSLRREVEASLRRLRTERLDLVQIHWPALPKGAPSPGIEAAWESLVGLQDEGKVRHLGVSNFSAEELGRVGAIAPVVSNQPPYSMLMRQVERDPLPRCREAGIGVLAYSPMQNGLLTEKASRAWVEGLPENDWRRAGSPCFREPLLSRVLELVEVLREVGRGRGAAVQEVALAWVLRDPVVTGAIAGARRPEQVDGLAGAAGLTLDPEELARIEAALPGDVELFG